jgi:hypothetical protein
MNTTAAAALAEYTTTEADTLATMLASAMRHMSTAHKYVPGEVLGGYAWEAGGPLRGAVEDMAAGFYDIINEAVAAGASRELMQVYV